jgi:hypothetical protein
MKTKQAISHLAITARVCVMCDVCLIAVLSAEHLYSTIARRGR